MEPPMKTHLILMTLIGFLSMTSAGSAQTSPNSGGVIKPPDTEDKGAIIKPPSPNDNAIVVRPAPENSDNATSQGGLKGQKPPKAKNDGKLKPDLPSRNEPGDNPSGK